VSARRHPVSQDCRARLRQLFDYLDGEVSPARCAALEKHLAACACCGDLVSGLRRAMDVYRTVGRQRLPPDVQRRAKRRVKQLLDERT